MSQKPTSPYPYGPLNQGCVDRPNGFNTTVYVRVTVNIEQCACRGPFAIGEEFTVTRSEYSNGSIHTMTVYTPKGKLTWKEYEIIGGEMPLPPNQPNMDQMRSTPQHDAQQIRMDKAAHSYAKRARNGNTVQY